MYRSPRWLIERPIAHRGLHDGNNRIYENTLSAFAHAIEKGFSIECDLQISADGVPVVFHDATLDRLTHERGPVRSRTHCELSQIRIGKSDDRIYPLADYLDFVAGQVPVILELKGHKEDKNLDDGFVSAVTSELRAYKGNVALMAFEHWLVEDIKAQMPDRPGGLTAKGDDSLYNTHMRAIEAYEVDFIAYDIRALPCAFVRDARQKYHLPVITWTVRNDLDMHKTYQYADQITFELFDPYHK